MAEITATPYYLGQTGSRKDVPTEQHYRFVRIDRTLTAAEQVAANTLKVFKLRKGETILPALSHIVAEASNVTVDLGDSITPDGFADGINLATSGKKEFVSGVIPAYETAPTVAVDEDGVDTTDVILTFATVTAASETDVSIYLAVSDRYKQPE